MQFAVQAGEDYLISFQPVSGQAAAVLRVYAGQGSQPRAQNRSSGLNQRVGVVLHNAPSGASYAEILPLYDDLAGTNVRYTLAVTPVAQQVFLPLVGR